ncbi:hypothetical protein BTJ39_17500 [Izhakiella australiensis]|uniref:Uncharacterized protein n=1 Tax=Izhakiella australiensis TaxID=1926881 RepID=A0A1S8YHV8_9GAMM|nr:hypothetical protein BTJ39_17500 [Izhakiella australiensis]
MKIKRIMLTMLILTISALVIITCQGTVKICLKESKQIILPLCQGYYENVTPASNLQHKPAFILST